MRSRIALVLLLTSLAAAQTYRGLVGTGIDSGQEGSRSRMFVNMGRTFRLPDRVDGGGKAPLDANGWPTVDFQTVIFHTEPCCPWDSAKPGPDDPERKTPDFSGTYAVSFKGQATVISKADPVTFDLTYDAATNTTGGTMNVPPGTDLLIIAFTATKRTPDSAPGSGITDLRLIRPGYPANTTQVFTNEFLDSLRPFSVIRYMGFLSTNDAEREFPYPEQRQWQDRHVPSDATQQTFARKEGVAWEYAILLANLTGKDMWINVPVSASDDYVRQLARLMKDTLAPGIRIYVEHSNEVWNYSFPQEPWNTRAAAADPDVKVNPATTSSDQWRVRRHAKRLVEISNIFKDTFADREHRIIRPVFAWWNLKTLEYRSALVWLQNHFNAEPKTLIWGIAQTHYFNDQTIWQGSTQNPNATVEQVIAAMRADSDRGVSTSRELHDIAQQYGLTHVTYEAGPDNGGGNTTAMGARIQANRDPRMKDLMLYDVRNNWFGLGEGYGLYMNLDVISAYTRWGCWGLAEDPKDLATPKFTAMQELVGWPLPVPRIAGVSDTASARAVVTPGGFVSLYGQGFAEGDNQWTAGVGGVLSTELAGVRVVVNGQLASVQYAGPGQVNILLPPGASGQDLNITVYGPGGTSTTTVKATPIAPGFFGYYLGSKFYASAVHANSGGIYVAAERALPTVTSRPAKVGDFVELYVSGLPVPPEAPAGKLLDRAYPIDWSGIRVTVGGVEQPVRWGGLRFAGVFQVNVEITRAAGAGDQPLVLTYQGQSTQPALITMGN